MSYLLDTNILVRLLTLEDPRNAEIVQALEALRGSGETCQTCAQVLIEYWAVATRPIDVNGLGLSPLECCHNIRQMVNLFPCVPEPPDILTRWETLVSHHLVLGRQAYDARIAALMQAHGLDKILTYNVDDFGRYDFIAALTPTDLDS